MSKPNVGLTVTKGVANSLTPPTLPDINSLDLLMRRKRGVPNKVFTYGDPDTDKVYFGGSEIDTNGREIVKSLFSNASASPVKLNGVRVVASDAANSTASLSSVGLSIDLVGGYLGDEDPGDWINGYEANIVVNPDESESIYMYFFTLKDAEGNVVETYNAVDFADLTEFITNGSKFVTVSGTVTANSTNPVVTVTIQNVSNTSFNQRLFQGGTYLFGMVFKNTNPNAIFPDVNKGDKLFHEDSSAVVNEIGTVEEFTITDTGSAWFFEIKFTPVNSSWASLIDVWDLDRLSFSTGTGITGTFAGGSDGTDSDEDYVTALDTLEGHYSKVTAVADTVSSVTTITFNSWAKSSGKFFITILPFESSESVAKTYSQTLRSNLEPGIALYDAWEKVTREFDGEAIWIPAYGWILGASYIRAVELAGGNIHIPPAGINSATLTSIEVSPASISQIKLNQYTRDLGINLPKFQEGLGYFIATSRTVSSNSLYHSIHTILQANYYRKILSDNLSWTLQIPITDTFDTAVINYVNAFFRDEYDAGALEGSIPFSEAFEVVSGEAINPATQDRKQRNFEFRYIPTEASEAVVIKLNRNDGALIATV